MSKFSRWKIDNRKVLVDAFQLRLVAVAIFHFLLIVLVFAAALFIPIIIELNRGDLTSPAVQAAAHEFLIMHDRLWPPLLGVFILLVLHNIVVSHRIAGPLFRFRRYIKAISEGDLASPIRIRKADYLHKDAEALSQMADSLRYKIIQMETQYTNANESWRNMKNSLAGGTSQDIEKNIAAMNECLEACCNSVLDFKTTEEETALPMDAAVEKILEPAKLEA
jgi:methyl-accepting chemotaxis protein